MRWTSLMREKRNKTGRVVLGKPEGKRRLGRKVMFNESYKLRTVLSNTALYKL